MKTTKYDPASARLFYLNDTGHRAVCIDRNGNRERLPVSLDGITVKARAVLYWEACGNFSFPVIRVRGKQVPVYPNTEVPPPAAWLPYGVKLQPQP